MVNPPPDWYPSPDRHRAGMLQWWDGNRWLRQFITDFSTTDAQRLSKAEARNEVMRLRQIVHQREHFINEHGLRTAEEFETWRASQAAEIEAEQRRANQITEEAQAARAELVSNGNTEAQRLIRIAQSKAKEIEDSLRNLDAQRTALTSQIEGLRTQVVAMQDTRDLQEIGYFDYEHVAENSTELATELESVRARIKTMLREKKASTASQNFTFNNSTAQGKKFVNALTKLLLRAYNAEAENAVKATRAGNLTVAQSRLSRAADQIAKHGEMIDMRITHAFHNLRLKEIELAGRHLQAVQREKELERERKAQLREQRKVEQELRKEQERLAKEKAHYAATLAALRANGDTEGAERMMSKLEDVERAINDVDYRAANIRAGYVYVVSNVGSFGAEVVKIGMTRRLDPMDRVRELGDASVPFNFDVHAMFFADDAVAIEAMLHREFAHVRINRVNFRREYFETTPQAVLEKLKEHRVEVLEFTLQSEATEFNESLRIRKLPQREEPPTQVHTQPQS